MVNNIIYIYNIDTHHTTQGAGSNAVNKIYVISNATSDCQHVYSNYQNEPAIFIYRYWYEMASSWIIQDATQYLATTFQEWYYVLSADNIPPKNGWGTNPGDGATITNGVEPFPIVVYFDATCDNVSSEVKNISITTNILQNNVTSTMGLPKKPPKEPQESLGRGGGRRRRPRRTKKE